MSKKKEIKEHIIWDSRDCDEFSFDDESENLNKELDNSIVVIADLGLWDGRHSGYKVLKRNLNAILTCASEGELKFYFDGKDVRCDQYHHDGVNHLLFREMKSDKDVDDFTDICYEETPTDEQIDEYTTSLGKYVKAVYGW